MEIWMFFLGLQAGVVVTFFALSLGRAARDDEA